MANRLKEIRKLRGVSAEQLAKRLNTTRSKIYKLERGEQRMTDAWIGRLAPELDVAPTDLIVEGALTVPIRYQIAAAFTEHYSDWDLPPPCARVQPARSLQHPETCVAAEIMDDSSDRLYKAGSIVILRRIEALDTPLAVGDKIVVRHFAHDRRDGNTMEILVGLLDHTIAGDLVLVTRSSNREVSPSVIIQPGHGRNGVGAELVDAGRRFPHETNDVDYEPADDDPAEILGRVVMAITAE